MWLRLSFSFMPLLDCARSDIQCVRCYSMGNASRILITLLMEKGTMSVRAQSRIINVITFNTTLCHFDWAFRLCRFSTALEVTFGECVLFDVIFYFIFQVLFSYRRCARCHFERSRESAWEFNNEISKPTPITNPKP